ncbi:Predicted arabinose efflux permease, MFS family [Rhizobiales bacterium GAS191]|nr:Predicted arabinose efflux permease, MFS family [Rhizobiales bacterium GAS113]SED80626.1 Predicted arabinose efflux permease, MFS family [Rhizobiales bacterium GAS191]
MIDRRWTILCVLFLARTAMGFQFQSIASVAPQLSSSLLITYTEIGLLIGLYFLPGALISLPGGFVMQRFGDKTICAFGLCLMVIGGLVLGMSESFAMAFAGRLISGTGAILFNQVLTKMATDWFAGREIVFAMAVVLASWPFGVAAGLLLQPDLATSFGWASVMRLCAGLCGLALLLVAVAYRSPPAASAGARVPLPGPARPLSLPPRPQLAPVTVAGIIWANANVGLVLFFSFTPELLREFGFSPIAAASLPSYALWILMLSVPLGGYLVQRAGRPDAAIILCCGVTGVTLALLSLDLAPAALCAIFGLVMGIPAGAVIALPARILSAEDRAAGLGVFFTAYYALMALGPLFAGWLRDRSGTAVTAMLFAAVLFLAIGPLLLLFQRLAAVAKPVAE